MESELCILEGTYALSMPLPPTTDSQQTAAIQVSARVVDEGRREKMTLWVIAPGRKACSSVAGECERLQAG